MLLLTFADYLPQARRLAAQLACACLEIGVHPFPDGESLVTLPTALPEHVLICRSLNQPNNKLIELLLSAKTARDLGAKRLSLIAPYLCYMRQDTANHPGEAVSQRIIGEVLAGLFDDVITVDPHLHRISALNQAIPLKNAISLTAANEIADFLKRQLDDAVLLGPDSESEQWVAGIAGQTGFRYAIAAKQRLGDTQVEITLPDFNFHGRIVVMVDDVASTGRTLAKAAVLLKRQGAKAVHAAITHALFCGNAEQQLRQAGVEHLWSTDSISHASACIRLDKLLANACRSLADVC